MISREIMEDNSIKIVYRVTWEDSLTNFYTADELTLIVAYGLVDRNFRVETLSYLEYLDWLTL